MGIDHIGYIIGSLIVVGLVIYFGTYIKKQKWKNVYIITWTFLCFFFHISTMYLTFFAKGNNTNHGNAYDNQIFPIYFCNFIMYLNLVCAIWHDKTTRFFKNMATFSAWGGIFGALITLFSTSPGLAPFLENPSWATWWNSWYDFQSSVSHTCLLIGSLLLISQGYVKLNVYNLIPFSFGIVVSAALGGFVMLIYWLGGKEIPNAMYLLHGPKECPEMHGGYFALAMIGIIFVITALIEQFTKKKEDRWYKSIKDINIYLPIDKEERALKAQKKLAEKEQARLEKEKQESLIKEN